MTERRKKLLRWLGYPLLGALAFVFALHFTFPYERLRERLIEELSREYDVGIVSIGPGWLPGRVKIEGLSITTRPKREDEKPKTIMIDAVTLSIGFLPLITKTISIDIDASLGAGEIVGNVSTSSAGLAIDLRTRDLSLESIPGVGVITGGAPIKGPVEAHIKLNLPKNKWAAASGVLEVGCSGCSIGDGVTKVRSTNPNDANNAFANAGFTLPRIGLGELKGRIPISKGVGCVEKFETKGGDLLLTLEGGIRFADPFNTTQAELQARYKGTEAFAKAAVGNAALFASAMKDGEGFATVVARSSLMGLVWRPSRTALAPLRECDGIAPPPTPPKQPSVAHIPPPPPVSPMPTAPARDAEEGPGGGQPPPPQPEPTPVAQPEPTPAPQPEPPPAPIPEAPVIPPPTDQPPPAAPVPDQPQQ